MSLYADYLRESIPEVEILERDYGFITFSIVGEECYCRNCFISISHRRKKLCHSFLDEVVEIARLRGCKYITSTVVPSQPGATESLRVHWSYGMKLHSANNNLIIFKKDI